MFIIKISDRETIVLSEPRFVVNHYNSLILRPRKDHLFTGHDPKDGFLIEFDDKKAWWLFEKINEKLLDTSSDRVVIDIPKLKKQYETTVKANDE